KRVFLVILFTSFSGSLVSRISGAVHRDEILAFNTRCGDGIFHGWNTASELWKFEIFPRTTIMMQHTSAIH
ncbi:hypothetical protein OFN25_23915, partial [Escherichia coli]|nr:hypothetical protein [Escherichia coli]